MPSRDTVANRHALISSNDRGRGGDAHEAGVVGMGPTDCEKFSRGSGPRDRPPGQLRLQMRERLSLGLQGTYMPIPQVGAPDNYAPSTE